MHTGYCHNGYAVRLSMQTQKKVPIDNENEEEIVECPHGVGCGISNKSRCEYGGNRTIREVDGMESNKITIDPILLAYVVQTLGRVPDTFYDFQKIKNLDCGGRPV